MQFSSSSDRLSAKPTPRGTAASTPSGVARQPAGDLAELLRDSIRLNVLASTPDDVMDRAGELLLASGGIERRYVDAMKASLVTNGPYMVIVPGVALLHARPQDGAITLCMSLITLEPGVAFGNPDNDPVTVAIAFAAADNQSHLDALSSLTALLGNDTAMATLRDARNVDEALAAIRAGSQEEAY